NCLICNGVFCTIIMPAPCFPVKRMSGAKTKAGEVQVSCPNFIRLDLGYFLMQPIKKFDTIYDGFSRPLRYRIFGAPGAEWVQRKTEERKGVARLSVKSLEKAKCRVSMPVRRGRVMYGTEAGERRTDGEGGTPMRGESEGNGGMLCHEAHRKARTL
ncbi:MAG: hypothetical protein IJ246_07855, partial [Clostridia bacterium]|nr:hypothetical protein [Clostridia bacterium]